jgi:hypothetical protein
LAERLRAMHPDPDRHGQIEDAYRLCLGRSPTCAEEKVFDAYIHEFGLANACRVIFNCNEFLFID